MLSTTPQERLALGVVRRNGVPLRLDVMVPASSPPRRQLAVILQEAWRRVGVEATVTAVDFAVFQERPAPVQMASSTPGGLRRSSIYRAGNRCFPPVHVRLDGHAQGSHRFA